MFQGNIKDHSRFQRGSVCGQMWTIMWEIIIMISTHTVLCVYILTVWRFEEVVTCDPSI